MQRAFEPEAGFDWSGFTSVTRTAVRMLDNVLDVTYWPLPGRIAWLLRSQAAVE